MVSSMSNARRAPMLLVAAIVLAAGLIGGCGPSANGTLPVASPVPSASAPASPGPSTPGPMPSASIRPSSSVPGEVVLIDDPDLSLNLPPGWRSMAVDEIRAQVDDQMAVATPSAKASYTEILRQIDAGDVRAGAIGPSGFRPWQGTMVIEVTTAESLEAQIEASMRLQTAFSSPRSTIRTNVTLPAGPAMRIMVVADPPPGQEGLAIPARGIAYFLDLGDGRIFWLTTTGPEASTTFEALIDGALATLMRR
jgi:hypothetical protein